MERMFDRLDRAIEYLVAALFFGIVVVGLLQVFNRFVLNASLSWSEEAQIFGGVWIIFLAIPIGYRRGAMIHMDTVRALLPRRLGRAFDLIVELLWAGFALSLVILSYRVSAVAALQSSPGLNVPMSLPYAGMIAGGVYLLVVALRRIAGWFTGRMPRGSDAYGEELL